ncbi:hypothetical protein TanjilG_14627 [Lupinus angustifolius]|uniref:Uncharacterized protein n=1 Tax=Lupinus angustifolius TaxID=3871 RepID=A0A1J7GMG9_LUPAN|nr:hypothetical protein TanjilG_14627 [Lupinus angustifolius]
MTTEEEKERGGSMIHLPHLAAGTKEVPPPRPNRVQAMTPTSIAANVMSRTTAVAKPHPTAVHLLVVELSRVHEPMAIAVSGAAHSAISIVQVVSPPRQSSILQPIHRAGGTKLGTLFPNFSKS